LALHEGFRNLEDFQEVPLQVMLILARLIVVAIIIMEKSFAE